MTHRALAVVVIVDGQAWYPGDVPPSEVADRIRNPKCWGESPETTTDPAAAGSVVAPPVASDAVPPADPAVGGVSGPEAPNDTASSAVPQAAVAGELAIMGTDPAPRAPFIITAPGTVDEGEATELDPEGYGKALSGQLGGLALLPYTPAATPEVGSAEASEPITETAPDAEPATETVEVTETAQVVEETEELIAAEDDADEEQPWTMAEPPRSGKGSGESAWRAFAYDRKVDVAEDDDRATIIAACRAAGVIQ